MSLEPRTDDVTCDGADHAQLPGMEETGKLQKRIALLHYQIASGQPSGVSPVTLERARYQIVKACPPSDDTVTATCCTGLLP